MPEKLMAGLMLVTAVLSRTYFTLVGENPQLSSINLGYLAIDVLMAVAMIAIAVRANRMYTLWMAGFQIIALMAHFARGMTDAISPIAYLIMYVGPSYFQIIILAFGIWFHHRRVKRHGAYRPWRNSWNPSLGANRWNSPR
jgi:uncharacterized membrane protein